MFQSLGALTGVQWTSAVTVSALAMAGMCQNEAGVQQGWRTFFLPRATWDKADKRHTKWVGLDSAWYCLLQ